MKTFKTLNINYFFNDNNAYRKLTKPILIFILVSTQMAIAQQQESNLPYYEMPAQATTFTAGTVTARMIDGLGFRYYWATEGLTATDLNYRANKEGRSSEETIDHILSLSSYIINTAQKKEIVRTDYSSLSFAEKRKQTLNNFKLAAEIIKEQTDFSENQMLFSTAFKLPFWNLLNGPIADALTHCGQLAIYRRSSGNPINAKANVLTGKLRD